jgi:RNA polymerase sigma factor (sigma-70 family)
VGSAGQDDTKPGTVSPHRRTHAANRVPQPPPKRGGQSWRGGTHRGWKMDASPTNAAPDLDAMYRRCKSPLLERARAWFPTLRGSEQDLYQAAWTSLLGSTRPIDDVEKYLEAALYSAGLKELRRRRRRPVVSLSTARFKNGDGGHGGLHQGTDALTDQTVLLPDEQVQVREEAQWVAELLDELTPLQRRVIKLHWGCGLRRRETAALLGVSERSVKRQMEAAQPTIMKSVELARAGRWCESKQSLVIAYALGLLSPTRAAKARMHLKRCSACRATAYSVRQRLEGVAGLLPLPVVALDHSSGVIARVAEVGDSIRGTFVDLASGAKQHSLALVSRTPVGDATATQVAAGGGLRGSGTMVAAVAACLAAGGGATYCTVEGLPTPVRSLPGVQEQPLRQSTENGERDDNPAQPENVATVPVTEPVAQPVPSSDTAGLQESHETDNVAPASPAPAGTSEFGSPPATRHTSAPAPAPRGGGGEFTP